MDSGRSVAIRAAQAQGAADREKREADVTRARLVVMLVAGLLVGADLSAARAADEDPDAWHVTLTPYAWAAGIYGDVTVRGLERRVDASFLDILEQTDTLVGLAGAPRGDAGTGSASSGTSST